MLYSINEKSKPFVRDRPTKTWTRLHKTTSRQEQIQTHKIGSNDERQRESKVDNSNSHLLLVKMTSRGNVVLIYFFIIWHWYIIDIYDCIINTFKHTIFYDILWGIIFYNELNLPRFSLWIPVQLQFCFVFFFFVALQHISNCNQTVTNRSQIRL